jgi:Spy/CpxP family protein refolding chaperone
MRNAVIALVFLFVTVVSASEPPQDQQRKRSKNDLNLTDTQQEQFQKISFEAQKKQIELRAKMETAKLELRRLMHADAVDKSAIEKKLNEIASSRTALEMNRINGWIEKNKVLTSEQQKLWKKSLHKNRTMAKEKVRDVQIERMRMQRRPMMQQKP